MGYAVERWGNGPERLVLVHGSLSVGTGAFSEQEALAKRFTVDVVTRRGYGDTPATDGVDIMRDAHDVIEVLGNGAHLVGTSMGGMVSMNAAGLRPDLVHSLTIIEPPAFAVANDISDVRRVSRAMEAHWANADPADLHGFVTGFVAALEMKMVLPDPLPLPLETAVRNLVTERPWRVDIPVGAIADAPFPKLVVTGGWSGAFDAICGRLADLFDTDLHILTGAGHGVQKLGVPFNSLLARHVEAAAQQSKEGVLQ